MAVRDLSKTLGHLSNAVVYDSSDVLLLVTIPLSRSGFKKWDRAEFDFVAQNSGNWDNLEEPEPYKQDLVVPVKEYCGLIENETRAKIVFDTTWQMFNKRLRSASNKLLILAAHHIGPQGESSKGKIQFFDRAIEFDMVVRSLQSLKLEGVTLHLQVCESRGFHEKVYRKIEGVDQIPFTEYKAPVTTSFLWLYHLIRSVNRCTFNQAYSESLQTLLKDVNDNEQGKRES